MTIRKSDFFWLRLACLTDAQFGDGMPYRVCPSRFEALAERGLVEIRPGARNNKGYAVATDIGRALVAESRARRIGRTEDEPLSADGLNVARRNTNARADA